MCMRLKPWHFLSELVLENCTLGRGWSIGALRPYDGALAFGAAFGTWDFVALVKAAANV